MLLALDTSTSSVTVALLGLDGGLLAEQHVIDPRGTTELLAPLVARAFEDAGAGPDDVELVAVGTGPGPFTGLRVGLVTAMTFGHARGVEVLGVPSHDALAHAWYLDGGQGRLLVATDARRKEVYASVYDTAADADETHLAWTRIRGPVVSKAADLPQDERALPTVGRGTVLYPDLLGNPSGELDVSAAAIGGIALVRHGLGVDQPTEPLYLRRPDATMPGAPKPALAPRPQDQQALRQDPHALDPRDPRDGADQ
jgi:tRNA threonylcarbamoyladenosine biosynthesis protein TsaB